MKATVLITLFAAFALNTLELANAQSPGKIPRIGFLTSAPTGFALLESELRQGLEEFGYVEGRNILIEWRRAGHSPGRLLESAKELARMKVDVIVTTATDSAVAAHRATTTIPIVGGLGGDPVAAGLIASLARPGGNITGVTSISATLGKKRLELLKEVTPNVSPVAVLWIPGATDSGNRFQMKDVESAARELSLDLQSRPVYAPEEFDSAFSAINTSNVHSIIVLTSPFFASEMDRIVRLATSSRLPVIYASSDWTDAGGLMSYGPNYHELFRRTAYYVHRILNGAKPADLPVETPTKFELVVNRKAAKQIGLTIPSSVLNRADRIIPDK